MKELVRKVGAKEYVRGYRRAMSLLAMGVGKLDSADAKAKEKLTATLNILDEELHEAEQAAK